MAFSRIPKKLFTRLGKERRRYIPFLLGKEIFGKY